MSRILIAVAAVLLAAPAGAQDAGRKGYYRDPAIHGDTIVFAAEGDLWTVGAGGGRARRLTTHLGYESRPAVSPDGTTVAFTAEYEGPLEVYAMPLAGGVPRRLTFEGLRAFASGWTPDGRVVYATRRHSGLPDYQLAVVPPAGGEPEMIPLQQAWEAAFGPGGAPVFFTRLHEQGSRTKRYAGGTAQNLWRWSPGDAEATPLTPDHAGTSASPMWWEGRLYFRSDRDGTMNLWSVAPDGSDPRQHTAHRGVDVQDPSLGGGRIVYQHGADLRVLDLASGEDRLLEITLDSDFDQLRERWVDDPTDFLTAAHPSPDGDRVVLTARGRVFVAPRKAGRLVQATRTPGVRFRAARFLPDGKRLLAGTDASGEIEFCTLPANGVGEPEAVTSDGTVFRHGAVPSPDGRRFAYADAANRLWVRDLEAKTTALVATSPRWEPTDFAWSPDGRWICYRTRDPNMAARLHLYGVADGKSTPLTSDRVDSYSPAWDPGGKWLWFLSDRHLESVVRSPWGSRQPEPFFDRTTKIYGLSLKEGERFPFREPDELHEEKKEEAEKKEEKKEDAGEDEGAEKKEEEEKQEDAGRKKVAGKVGKGERKLPEVSIDLEGLAGRLYEVPVPPGNYDSLAAVKGRLLLLSTERGAEPRRDLVAVPIRNEDPKVETVVREIDAFEVSADGSTVLVRRKKALHLFPSNAKKVDLGETRVDLSGWRFPVAPAEEWRQMFVEAWRMQRDYFYDPGMHGVDWRAMLERYLPLVDRVTNRGELTDLLGQMLGEVSALHTFVFGGEHRGPDPRIGVASLGARLAPADGGWRIERIWRSDPDYPAGASPLARPDLGIAEGDGIVSVNGIAAAGEEPGRLLRNQAGRQVLLEVRSAATGKVAPRIVKPISASEAADLRYSDWEEERRRRVEEAGKGEIGYVHLRAMGRADVASWARQFYPVFDRKGLIVDVRHNGGGNIDSWILGKLLRRAWFFWKPRVGAPYWNMQYAFRGHAVVLCNERTGSDGEAFTEGFRRLGLGKVIGTRTWGGEIWLSMDDWLVDRGFATAAETGVYGPEGKWLIEGHGVEPDLVVDNPPHRTFLGEDAQLEAALDHLQRRIAEEPVEVPDPPPYPDKSLEGK